MRTQPWGTAASVLAGVRVFPARGGWVWPPCSPGGVVHQGDGGGACLRGQSLVVEVQDMLPMRDAGFPVSHADSRPGSGQWHRGRRVLNTRRSTGPPEFQGGDKPGGRQAKDSLRQRQANGEISPEGIPAGQGRAGRVTYE
jgi:hypothetical protein